MPIALIRLSEGALFVLASASVSVCISQVKPRAALPLASLARLTADVVDKQSEAVALRDAAEAKHRSKNAVAKARQNAAVCRSSRRGRVKGTAPASGPPRGGGRGKGRGLSRAERVQVRFRVRGKLF